MENRQISAGIFLIERGSPRSVKTVYTIPAFNGTNFLSSEDINNEFFNDCFTFSS